MESKDFKALPDRTAMLAPLARKAPKALRAQQVPPAGTELALPSSVPSLTQANSRAKATNRVTLSSSSPTVEATSGMAPNGPTLGRFRAPKVPEVLRENLALPELTAPRAPPVKPVLKVPLARRGVKVRKVLPERMVELAPLGSRAPRAHKALLVPKAPPVLRGRRVSRGYPVRTVPESQSLGPCQRKMTSPEEAIIRVT